ncbi:MAG: hypothetical protein R3F14_38485 [Polyangiaceae bacterium]
MRAKTLTIEPVDAEGWAETAGVLEALEEQDTGAGYGALLGTVAQGAGAAIGGSYGGIVQGAGQVLGGLIDGKAQSGASMGKSLGGLAGSALGTALGGPVGGALAGAAGEMLGGVVGGAVDNARKKPSKKNARKAARAKAQAKTQARLDQLEAAQARKPETRRPPPPRTSPAPGTAPATPRPHLRIPIPGREGAAPKCPPAAARPPVGGQEPARLDPTAQQEASLAEIEAMVAEADRRAIASAEAEIATAQAEREAADIAAEIARAQGMEDSQDGWPETAAPAPESPAVVPPAAPGATSSSATSTQGQAPKDDGARTPPATPQARPEEHPRSEAKPAGSQAQPRPAARPAGQAPPEPATTPPPPAQAALPVPAASTATERHEPPPVPPQSPAKAPSKGATPTDTAGDYDDAAAPPARRPRPRRHLGLIPLRQHQLEAMLAALPALRRLDTRLLRLMSGRGSTVRDTAGIDAAARAYIAIPGETAAGIAKKLTGREERAADLLAANPGRREGEPWRIPPGWMHFVTTDTGEIDDTQDTAGTSRFYIVQSGDTPVGVATKSGAKAARPQWWSELKAANPQIPTKDNGQNFEKFYAGQQLWIPEPWPTSALFLPASPAQPAPALPQTPGFPGLPAIPGLSVPQIPGFPGLPNTAPTSPSTPGGTIPGTAPNTTVDPGVPLQAQGLLAYWARSNPGSVNPPDYGMSPADYTGTTSARFVSALASFQQWYNARNPASPLRVDGTLDEPTYKALHASTVAALPQPGPGAVPYPKPEPQATPSPGAAFPPPSPQLLALLLSAASGIPGIHGGLPQLGGLSFPGAANIPIRVLRSKPTPLPPGAVPGFHVNGQPPSAVWDFDGTMVSLPPGIQPLDAIYGTPPPDFVWQGGMDWPGPSNLPWVQAANPIPVPATPWPWNPAAPTQPASPPTEPNPQSPAQSSDGGLPIAGLLAALAFIA